MASSSGCLCTCSNSYLDYCSLSVTVSWLLLRFLYSLSFRQPSNPFKKVIRLSQCPAVSSKAFQLYLKYNAKFRWSTRASVIWLSFTSADLIFYDSAFSFLCFGHKCLLMILSHTNIRFALDLSPIRHFPHRYLYG